MENIIGVCDNLPSSSNIDPYCLHDGQMKPWVMSFNTMDMFHPDIKNWVYNTLPKYGVQYFHGDSVRLPECGPIHEAAFGLHIFMGGMNSTTGFTSSENNFAVMCPVVVFKGKMKFSCQFMSYPVFSLPKITCRSDTNSLPAESFKVEYSVDMYGGEIVLEPEANLIAEPEYRFQEYLRRKEQMERCIDQSMQDHITMALSRCPTMAMCRMRKEAPDLKKLLQQRETVTDFVYGEIRKQVDEFCSWTLDPISIDGALQDAYFSLLNDTMSNSRPDFIVTTPEIADIIATGRRFRVEPRDVLYTVAYGGDESSFMTNHIVPYQALQHKVGLETASVSVCGREFPILQVPHLKRENNTTSNAFEQTHGFWCFNEIGYLPKFGGIIDDYKKVDRTRIKVTDLRIGTDGTFSMDDCLRKGGFLLPETYNRFRYQIMLSSDMGLQDMLCNETDESSLIDLIDGDLPLDSKYNLYFPSSKVRFQNKNQSSGLPPNRCNFRSTGIFGNRASFNNWHPPKGDLFSAKDFLAKRFKLRPGMLDRVFSYAKGCSEIAWTKADVKWLIQLNTGRTPLSDMSIQQCLADPSFRLIIQDMIQNKGFSKFACMPRFVEKLAAVANVLLQSNEELCRHANIGKDDMFVMRTVRSDIEKIVHFRSDLIQFAKKILSVANKTNLPHGLLTSCPPSTPVMNRPALSRDWKNVEDAINKDIRFAYRLYLLCIAPLIFTHVYSIDSNDRDENIVVYEFPNPDPKVPPALKTERFQQPYFKDGFLTSMPPMFNSVEVGEIGEDGGEETEEPKATFDVRDVSEYDPLYRFDLDIIKDKTYSRNSNFFDHFVSHRYQYLRQIDDEPQVVKATAAILNMTSYTPQVESVLGHSCLMNRKYRIVRHCTLQTASIGLYRGGKENLMYAVGNLSTDTKLSANNEISITQRVHGGCFIIDPYSCGRVIQNVVSKGLVSGMTSTLANVHTHVRDGGGSRMKNEWWNNLAYVVEALPGRHPIQDQHYFIPLNGRHLMENYNENGNDLTKIDYVAPQDGWYSENMYSTRGFSEAQLIFGTLLNGSGRQLPIYSSTEMNGLSEIHNSATVDRKEMAGKIANEVHVVNPVFSGQSNLGFLERQIYHSDSATDTFASDGWASFSPLKKNSCSNSGFVDALNLSLRRGDRGIKVLDGRHQGVDENTAPFRTGVKGIYPTERTR
jgi:hypothetical protein